MNPELAVLIAEAMSVYFLVLWAHSLRSRAGLAPFYALIGGITAVMSWVTDAGIKVDVAGITFMVGSTVFYTALMLGIFVVYVLDGPRATRIAIATVAGVSRCYTLVLNCKLSGGGQRRNARIRIAPAITEMGADVGSGPIKRRCTVSRRNDPDEDRHSDR